MKIIFTFLCQLEDIEFLSERLHASVQDLSSFDEYCTEIRSGRLQWSPVHKSEKFWRENAQRFNEKNFELIKFEVVFKKSNRKFKFLGCLSNCWNPVAILWSFVWQHMTLASMCVTIHAAKRIL